MVPGYVDRLDQVEAAPPPPDVQGQIPYNKPYITELCTNIFLKLLLLVYTIWSVYLLVMQPKTPKFKVESATIQLHAEGPKLTAEWDITFLTTTNNFNVYYKRIHAGFFYEYGHVLFSLVKTPRPSFVSNKRNQTLVEWKFKVWKKHLGYQVVEAISSGEGVSFRFRLICSAWFVSTLLPPEHAWLDAFCRVEFRISPHNNKTGTMTSHKCEAEYYKNYMFEVLVICSWLLVTLWACFFQSQAKHQHASHLAEF